MGLIGMLYRAARTASDAKTITKGPGAVARRQARKAAYRTTGKLLRKLL